MFVLQDKDNVLEVKLAASGQFSNLNLISYIQISNFNFLKLYPFFFNLTTFGRERWGMTQPNGVPPIPEPPGGSASTIMNVIESLFAMISHLMGNKATHAIISETE
jgi:hypothetical protein